MITFIVGVVIGLAVGWIVPAPDAIQNLIDKVMDKLVK